jgi:hypothetical protein
VYNFWGKERQSFDLICRIITLIVIDVNVVEKRSENERKHD